MKYIKTFEGLSTVEESLLKKKISTYAIESIDDDDPEFDDCPFIIELSIIHQKDHINDIFWDVTNWNIENLTLGDFRFIYHELVDEAEETILKYIKEDPSLYEPYLDNYLDIPDWIKNTKKYNL